MPAGGGWMNEGDGWKIEDATRYDYKSDTFPPGGSRGTSGEGGGVFRTLQPYLLPAVNATTNPAFLW